MGAPNPQDAAPGSSPGSNKLKRSEQGPIASLNSVNETTPPRELRTEAPTTEREITKGQAEQDRDGHLLRKPGCRLVQSRRKCVPRQSRARATTPHPEMGSGQIWPFAHFKLHWEVTVQLLPFSLAKSQPQKNGRSCLWKLRGEGRFFCLFTPRQPTPNPTPPVHEKPVPVLFQRVLVGLPAAAQQ